MCLVLNSAGSELISREDGWGPDVAVCVAVCERSTGVVAPVDHEDDHPTLAPCARRTITQPELIACSDGQNGLCNAFLHLPLPFLLTGKAMC